MACQVPKTAFQLDIPTPRRVDQRSRANKQTTIGMYVEVIMAVLMIRTTPTVSPNPEYLCSSIRWTETLGSDIEPKNEINSVASWLLHDSTNRVLFTQSFHNVCT